MNGRRIVLALLAVGTTTLRWGIRLVVLVWHLPAILLMLACLGLLYGRLAYHRAQMAWRRRGAVAFRD